jgi:L-lysine exporter family protein LysE/ArgO
MVEAGIAGLTLGLGLIVAIGAQNAFVLRQGLLRAHVFAVCLTCAASDTVLITAGVAGAGALVAAAPGLASVARWGGAGFLTAFGGISLWRAWRGAGRLEAGTGTGSLRRALGTCLALTWLNPHVYLDTVVLLGAVSAGFEAKAAFAAGAIIASFAFFFALGYGAKGLRPVFGRPGAWRVLDAAIAAVMWAIAANLVAH